MSSIFSGGTGLRTRFSKTAFGQFSTATSKATSIQVQTFDIAVRYLYANNRMDQACEIYLVAPGMDATVAANRLFWYELESGEVLNQDQIPALGMEIDPGTKMFLSVETGTPPSSGYVKFLAWG